MPEHVHVHAPHEMTEASEATSRRERLFELGAILLMSLATLGIAWSGYQAAKWSGLQARQYAQANTARSLANRASTLGSQERLQDLLNFNRWLEATTAGDTQIANLYRRRFRAEFIPAFEAWQKMNALTNQNAEASPLNLPQYAPADVAKADELEHTADEHFEQGKEATENADDYVFGTVFFAVVLFFAGISLRFRWDAMRIAVLTMAALFLVYGGVKLASLPTM
jgi:transposase